MINPNDKDKGKKQTRKIPLDNPNRINDTVHTFRIGVKKEDKSTEKILSFAGCWDDMSEKDYNEFMANLKYRRTISRRLRKK